MSATTITAATNGAINAARDLPDLVARLQTADPALAEQITGKALTASKTLYGAVLTLILTYAVQKFNLGWGADLISLLAGGLVLVGLRLVTRSPIAGLFAKPVVP